MVCDCILTKEERARGMMGCGDDCLNRMLMIEWYCYFGLLSCRFINVSFVIYFDYSGSRCTLGDHCSNKRFSKVKMFFVFAYLLNCVSFFSRNNIQKLSPLKRRKRAGVFEPWKISNRK